MQRQTAYMYRLYDSYPQYVNTAYYRNISTLDSSRVAAKKAAAYISLQRGIQTEITAIIVLSSVT